MEFRILGTLEVFDGDRRIELGGHKQRALLAALLLHANEVVSQDVLVDELWGETPPATATKTLHAHVARLRRALAGESGTAPLETRGHGYVLTVEPGQLDADVFRGELDAARQALADGDSTGGADTLRRALELWRGPSLADFAYDDFAQEEIARLEELRLAAIEERVDADLALGRHAELIPELQALVDRHPLRERLRASFMIALYRSGRQAEALQVYQQGRQALASELGLEPSPALQQLERRILDHDPELAGPASSRRPSLVPAAAWRHPRRVAAVGAVILVIAAGAVAVQLTRETETAGAAGAIALDPRTGSALGTVPLGSTPSSVAVGAGSVWVLDANDRTIAKVDPATREVVRTFSTTLVPTDIAAGADALWVANGPTRSGGATGEVFAQSVSRVDPESGEVDVTIQLPRGPGGHLFAVLPGLSRQYIAVTHDAVWAINPGLTVSRIDPRTNNLVATVKNVRAENIAAGEGDVWVTEGSSVAQIDPGSNRVSRRIQVDAEFLAGVAVGAGAVWVADPFAGAVWRIDPEPTEVKRKIEVDAWVAGVAFGEGAVWATNEVGDAVYRIDPRTNVARLVHRTPAPRGVAAGEEAVWVTAAAPPSRNAALPRSVCGEVVYGGTGSPDLLLVSDLPLKGPSRKYTLPMTRAIELVLEQRNFEAGGFSVGFQSCDPASAQSGQSDFFRCGTNAKAYARNLRVAGVVGSYQSFCTYLQLPITNRAEGGPLAMLSPSNTLQELTENEELYPTGVRNYVRIAAADHLQAVGHAELVRSLGRRSLFVVSPRGGGPNGETFSADVRTAARRLGIRVAGAAVYDTDRRSYTAFARAVARAQPEAVVIDDILEPDSGALLRELRATLGPGVALIAPDGFLPFELLPPLAGPAATSVYITQYGVPNSELPPRGKQFLASFAAQSGGAGPDFSAAYGAQAAELLLDAIARSDGTRASVTRELRRTRISDGILGAIRFDRNGDLVDAPITVFRAADEGLVVDRVVTARSALLRGR